MIDEKQINELALYLLSQIRDNHGFIFICDTGEDIVVRTNHKSSITMIDVLKEVIDMLSERPNPDEHIKPVQIN